MTTMLIFLVVCLAHIGTHLTTFLYCFEIWNLVAQSVEHWTPYGGSIRPCFKSPGFEARRAPDVYRGSWRVWLRLVAGRSQSKSAIGTGRARLCAYVKLSTLNSAIDPEMRDRKVEDRANATTPALRGLCPYQSFQSKDSD